MANPVCFSNGLFLMDSYERRLKMATPAYSELYLSDAMKTLAHFVDYSIHECGFDPDELGFVWYKSEACRLFSRGNP